METGLIIMAIISAVVGVVSILYVCGHRRRSSTKNETVCGVLHVDCCDSEYEPDMLLSLSVPVSDIVGKKRIALDVNVIRQNSQK